MDKIWQTDKAHYDAWAIRIWKMTHKPKVFALFDTHKELAYAVVCNLSALKAELSNLQVYNEDGELISEIPIFTVEKP